MKIEKQLLEDHQIKLVVEVEHQPFEEAKQRAARKLAKQVKIPGFRPGKAPYPVIVRHIGEPAIVEEAIEILANDVYPDAIDQAEIEPYGMGFLENIPNLDPPVFEFIIPLKAIVELGDYASLRLPYELKEVSDPDVDAVLSNLRDRQAVIEPVERPAHEGDLVRIRLQGERKEANAGEDLALVRDRALPVVIESENTDNNLEWPFPGFSRRLIGVSVGDQREFEHTISEDSEYKPLKGVSAIFKVSVEQVNNRTLPELNDEFAASVGDYANLEELRSAIRQDLEKQTTDSYNQEYDDKLIDEVISISNIKYPPQMLAQEIETVINRLESNLAQQNLDLDLYLKSRQIDMEALKEEVKPVAEVRLKKSLTLLELADKERITINPDELQSETNRTLDELSYYMQEKDFHKMLQTNEARTNLVSNVMMELLLDRTQTRLRDIGRGLVIEQAQGEIAEQSQAVDETQTVENTPVDSASTEDQPQSDLVEAEPLIIDSPEQESNN